MEVQKIAPLECPECKSKNVNRKAVVFKGKTTNAIITCMDCRKDYSEKDGQATEHKTRPFYGKSGTMVSRYEMGDYKDNQGN